MISDLSKKLAKEITSLNIKKYRDETGLFFVEGEKFVNELPDGWDAAYYVISEGFFAGKSGGPDAGVIRGYENRAPVYAAPDGLYQKLSGTVSPQGILAVCKKRPQSLEDMYLTGGGFFVYCDGVSDPGNAGTLLRTADAAGAAGFVLSGDSTDVFAPKAIRACAGSVFHLPVIAGVGQAELLEFIDNAGIKLVAADPRGKISIYELDFSGKCCIAVGNEAHGLSEDLRRRDEYLAYIPMPGRAESLNASVAGGVIIYEAVRRQALNFRSSN